MDGNVINNDDDDLRTYVSTLEQTVIQLNERLLSLEGLLSNEVSSLSTKHESLQTQVGTQSNLLSLETTNRANTVQHVDDRVSSLEVTHSKHRAYIVGLVEDHHGEQINEAASIRASLSEERSERVIGDEAVLAKLTTHEEQAQWYYDDTKAHLAKHDQALDDRTWDQDTWTLDDDDYTFGWSILAAAQEWELYIGQYVNQLQSMVSDQLRKIETTVVQAQQEASQALENTDIDRLLATLQGQIGIESLDAILWGRVEAMEDAIGKEKAQRITQITEEARLQAARLAEEVSKLTEQLGQESTERIDAIAAEADRRTELMEMEAQERIATINALAASSSDALIAKALELSTDYDAKISALRSQVTLELQDLQDGVTVSVEELKSADASIIASLNAYKVSNGQNIAALQDSVNVVTDAQESTANQVTALTASFDQLDSTVAQAQADIITSNQARADGDAALTLQINSLNTGLGNANSRIDTVSESVSTLDSATATKFSALDAELVDVNTSVASTRQIADSAVSTNTAQASEINTLKSRMSTTENNVTKKADATALSTLETKVDNADAALANRIDELVAELTTPVGTEIDAHAFNTLRAEVTNHTGTLTTHTSQITSLQSSLTSVNTGLSANADAVADLSSTVSQHEDSITSQAQSIQQLQSDLDVAESSLATKASTSALNTTNTNVSNLGGRVTANTNSLNSLGSRLDSVEGEVSTKLDASAINDYYSKTETDDKATTIAAGEVSKYDSSLKVGGENLWSLDDATAVIEQGNATVEYIDRNKENYKVTVTAFSAANFNKIRHDSMLLSRSLADVDKNSQYTLSFEIRAIKESNLTLAAYFNGANTVTSISVSTEWQRFEFTPSAKPVGTGEAGVSQQLAFRVGPSTGWVINDWYEVRHIQMQKGTKATAFSKATLSLQKALDANASAIQSTNSEVNRINGVVTSQASSISSLESSLSDVDTKADTAINNASTAQTTANTAVTKADANASSISTLAARVETAEGNINIKADASSLSSLSNTVTTLDGKVTANSQSLNSLIAEVEDTTSKVATHTESIDAWADATTAQAHKIEKITAEFTPAMAGNEELLVGNVTSVVGYENVLTSMADVDVATQMQIDTLSVAYATEISATQAKVEDLTLTLADTEMAFTSRITTMESNFESVVTDQLTPAVNQLQAKIEQEYITIADANNALAQATSTLKTEVVQGYTDAVSAIKLDAVTIPDTRSANQPPSWYWTNYPRSRVTEFKTSTVIGLTTAQVGNTFGTLTTIVPWTGSSGGPIRQIMEGSSEDKVYVRYSTSGTTWSAWTKQGATLQVSITEQSQAIDGIKGIKTVTIDNNGVMSGYGLVSQLVNGQVTSAFGVNANQFYVGSPSTGKKVFAVVNGTTVINDAVIGNLSAAKITTGAMHGDRITANTLKGDRIVGQSITADKLSSKSVSGMFADFGVMTTYVNPKAADRDVRARVIMKGSGIEVYDNNNILRVELGLF